MNKKNKVLSGSIKNGRKQKRCNNKSIFPKIEERLKFRINVTQNFTAIVKGRGKKKAYLHKNKIIVYTTCP